MPCSAILSASAVTGFQPIEGRCRAVISRPCRMAGRVGGVDRRLQQRQSGRVLATSGKESPASPCTNVDQHRVEQMIHLVNKYFGEFMSTGNMQAAEQALDPGAQHKDMVRDMGYNGIVEIKEYVQQLKKDFPSLYVKATNFGVADDHTLFCSFEGRATDKTPTFTGVDMFCFNDGATRIKEVQVYRSNWLGAIGHEDRKKQHAAAAGR